MNRRVVRRREALAIKEDVLHRDEKAMWWDAGIAVPINERYGSVEVVYVRGSLNHHAEPGCDSYEDIIERARRAFDGFTCSSDGKGGCVYEEGVTPDAVVLRVDSPGGVVSGLNETVFALRRMSQEKGIPLIAYVDELAASAAYALVCACDEIVLPPSGIAGSIGVISAMYDQTKADEEMGIRFVTITSGARKADGHPHVPITDEAVAAEQRRVNRLAKQFYNLVAEARPLTVKEIASYQAGIFLGDEAVEMGLADAVMGWDELVAALNETGSVNTKSKNSLAKLSQPESAINTAAQVGTPARGESPMSIVGFKALIKRANASLDAETDPKKRSALAVRLATYTAALEAYKKEKHTIEKHETEEAEDEADEEDEESDESSEESEAKGNETDRKEKDMDGDDDDDADDDDDEEDDEEEGSESSKKSAKAISALVYQATGKKGRAAAGALAAMIAEGQRAAATVAQITKERRAEKKAAVIGEALNARAIFKHEAKELRGKPLAFVTSFIDMRRDKSGKLKAVVHTEHDSLHVPDPTRLNASGELGAEVMAQINDAVEAAPAGIDRDKLRKAMIEAHTKKAGSNGVGRY